MSRMKKKLKEKGETPEKRADVSIKKVKSVKGKSYDHSSYNLHVETENKQTHENVQRKASATSSHENIQDTNQDNKDKELSKRQRRKLKRRNNTASEPLEGVIESENIQEEPKKKKLKYSYENGNNNCSKPECHPLSKDKLMLVRKAIYDKMKIVKTLPKLVIHEPCRMADLTINVSDRKPLFFSDIQHFMIYTQLGHMTTGNLPSFLNVSKYTNLSQKMFVIVEGVSVVDYLKCTEELTALSRFKVKAEVITPIIYGSNILDELATVSLTEAQKKRLLRKYENLIDTGKVFKIEKGVRLSEKSIRQLGKPCTNKSADKFSRLDLLLNHWQMLTENFPVPFSAKFNKECRHYVFTKEVYDPVTPNSPMWAIDCEMCMTKCGSELTRVSVINENHEVVYESLVKPYNEIINYLTQYSGITEPMLRYVTTRLKDVQKALCKIFPPDVILIGHSLSNDLHALQMMHPYVIDTSVIFNMSGVRSRKSKLKLLAAEYLSEEIQRYNVVGHDSVEDASAALKLVQAKLQHSLEWGDAVLSGPRSAEKSNDSLTVKTEADNMLSETTVLQKDPLQNIVNINIQETENIQLVSKFTTSIFEHFVSYGKKAALIAKDDIVAHFITFMPPQIKPDTEISRMKCIRASSNKEIIHKAIEISSDVGITLAHIRVESIQKVEKLAKKLWKKCNEKALISIVLAGTSQNRSHGLCFLDIKPVVFEKIEI